MAGFLMRPSAGNSVDQYDIVDSSDVYCQCVVLYPEDSIRYGLLWC